MQICTSVAKYVANNNISGSQVQTMLNNQQSSSMLKSQTINLEVRRIIRGVARMMILLLLLLIIIIILIISLILALLLISVLVVVLLLSLFIIIITIISSNCGGCASRSPAPCRTWQWPVNPQLAC